jgi:chorismate synthase
MSFNTFGHIFRVTTWGESHGPALGATVDGCPPGVPVRRRRSSTGSTAQARAEQVHHPAARGRRGRDPVGRVRGRLHRHPIQLMIRNTDQRSKDYGDIAEKFRPGHADITYWQKYGIRDYRGGGRSSARETAARVAAGGVARAALASSPPDLTITGYMVQMGPTASTATASTGTRSNRTRSGRPTRRPRPTGPTISTPCANPATASARSSRSRPAACPRASARRSTASSTPTSPPR